MDWPVQRTPATVEPAKRQVLVTGTLAGDPRFAATGWTASEATAPDAGDPLIVMADLRREVPPALGALGQTVAAARGALIAVIAQNDSHAMKEAVAAGITHHIAEPFDSDMLEAVLTLAARHVERGNGRRKSTVAPTPSPSPAHHGTPLYAVSIGLKRFDAINTAFGRETGDVLLAAAQSRIANYLSTAGVDAQVERGHGPEFIVTIGSEMSDRVMFAQQLLTRLERPFLAGDHLISAELCAGIAEKSTDGVKGMIRRAHLALISAREENVPIRVSTADEDSALASRTSLEADLRRALDNDEIEILFQPQVRIATGRIVGVEALARWHHPVLGMLGAETLFAAAERSNYMSALSAHVQRRAALKAASWPAPLSDLRLSVNVTANDIARPGFDESFMAMIAATKFPPQQLTVEITETGLIENLEAAATLLAKLRGAGCRVAIDDFGTGYSSLAYLKALPLDYLKVDRRLSHDITGTARDRVVVRGVIDMARALGLTVIAEGVETEEQLTMLAAEGCNVYQGFLCAPPLSTEALTELVVAQG